MLLHGSTMMVQFSGGKDTSQHGLRLNHPDYIE